MIFIFDFLPLHLQSNSLSVCTKQKKLVSENISLSEQNVAQCYNTYVTKYTSSVREKCEDVFVKTCRIVQRPRTYNHTVRMCKRPLVKDCSYQTSVSSPSPLVNPQFNILQYCSYQSTVEGTRPLGMAPPRPPPPSPSWCAGTSTRPSVTPPSSPELEERPGCQSLSADRRRERSVRRTTAGWWRESRSATRTSRRTSSRSRRRPAVWSPQRSAGTRLSGKALLGS